MAGPDWLKLAAQAASLRNVAVAICQTPTGWHVGLLFFDADRESLRLLDLAWHLKLRNEPFDAAKPEYRFVELQLPALRQRVVAAHLSKIWNFNREGGLPYAFSPGKFLPSGEVVFAPGAHGFTYATFVLQALSAAGITLIHVAQWSERAGDEEWQCAVIDLLRQGGASEEHLAAVKSEPIARRIRPAEVAGAASCAAYPVSFDAAKSAAELLVATFTAETEALDSAS